jgi:hypothetical protein
VGWRTNTSRAQEKGTKKKEEEKKRRRGEGGRWLVLLAAFSEIFLSRVYFPVQSVNLETPAVGYVDSLASPG